MVLFTKSDLNNLWRFLLENPARCDNCGDEGIFMYCFSPDLSEHKDYCKECWALQVNLNPEIELQ